MYVLAEGWNSGELTDEVEVGGGDCVNGTAVKHRQSLVSRQSQILDGGGKVSLKAGSCDCNLKVLKVSAPVRRAPVE